MAAPAYVEMAGVPEHLELPLRPGRNLMVTVTVHGAGSGAVTGVWLARSPDAVGAGAVTMALTSSRAGWTFNLGDPRIVPLLVSTGVTGTLHVVAVLKNGRTIAGVPIVYGRRVSDGAIYVVTKAGGAREKILPSRADRIWFPPGGVDAIEVEFDALAPDAAVRIGDRSWPLEPTAMPGLINLKIGAEIAREWAAAGALEVVWDRGQHRIAVRAVPESLRLPEGGAEVAVIQRRTAELPGSNGFLVLRLGDISAGRVPVTLYGRDGRTLHEQRFMAEGDTLGFDVGDDRYSLALTKLVNLLVGDDHAEFRVSTATFDARPAIDALLAAVARSRVTFIRNDQAFGPEQAAAFLRRKLDADPAATASVEVFISRIATRSSATGHPYQIRERGGPLQPAAEWLRQLSKETGAGR